MTPGSYLHYMNRAMNIPTQRLLLYAAVISGLLCSATLHAADPLRVMILSGTNVHDGPGTARELERIYTESGRFRVVKVVNDPSTCTSATLARCDVIVCNWTASPEMRGDAWGETAEKAISDFVRGGGGFVAFVSGYRDWPEFNIVKSTLKSNFARHAIRGTFRVMVESIDHPITRGLNDFWTTDELYQDLVAVNKAGYQVLGKAYTRADIGGSGKFEPVLITTEVGSGRGFNLLLGHDIQAMRNIGFRTLLLRGTEWAALGRVTLAIPADWPGTATKSVVSGLDFDSVLKSVSEYHFGQPRLALSQFEQIVIDAHSAPNAKGLAQRKQLAAKIATILGTDIAPEAKAFLCQQLALIGDEKQVAVLLRLLRDEQTADACRSALERIPGPASARALREALAEVKPDIRLGIVNSIGNRRDRESLPTLVELVKNSDVATAAAAATALGKIGGDQAVNELSALLDRSSGQLHEVVVEALLRSGNPSVFDKLQQSTEAPPTRMAAWRGEVMAHPKKADELIVKALEGTDLDLRMVAIRVVRELPKTVNAGPLAEHLFTLPPEASILLLRALADRGEKSALPAVMGTATNGDAGVRVAALQTIGALGDLTNVKFLVERAEDGSSSEKKAALEALGALRGSDVNVHLVNLLEGSSSETKILVLQTLAQRGAREMIEAPVRLATSDDLEVRLEAWQTLEELGRKKDLLKLVELLVRAQNKERDTAEHAIIEVVKRPGPPDQNLANVASFVRGVWNNADSAAKSSLVRVLAAIGDEKALVAVRAAFNEKETPVREAAINALGNWSTSSPLIDLFELACNPRDSAQRVEALRAFVRLASVVRLESDVDIVGRIRVLLELKTSVSDGRSLFELLAKRPSPNAIWLALNYLKDSELKDSAAEAIVGISKALVLVETNKDAVRYAMEQVQSVSTSPQILSAAKGILQRASKPRNLAIGATASSPDGLDSDGESGPDQAAIDGDPKTFWDETDNQPLYRFKVTFPNSTTVNAINIQGHAYHSYCPKDFDILCDGVVVQTVRNAEYDKESNEVLVRFPMTNCTSLELRITGNYGGSPGIRELEVYKIPSLNTSTGISPKRAIPARAFSWRQNAKGLALLNGDHVIWELNCAKGVGKATFYPLSLVDGTELTWMSPPDHVWHRSLWFSWKDINGVSYWEDDPQGGVTEVLEASFKARDDFSASATIRLSYHPASQPSALIENRVLEVTAPDVEGRYAVRWNSEFVAQGVDLLLNGGTAGGGYAGLSVRVAKNTQNWRVLDSEGREDTAAPATAPHTHGQHARWMDFSFADKVTGQDAGIAIFDHPSNLRYPSYWHVVITEETAFGYFSPAPLWKEPFRLPSGQKLDLNYQVLVHPGRLGRTDLDAAWEKFQRASNP